MCLGRRASPPPPPPPPSPPPPRPTNTQTSPEPAEKTGTSRSGSENVEMKRKTLKYDVHNNSSINLKKYIICFDNKYQLN